MKKNFFSVLLCRKDLGVLRDVFFLFRKASAGDAAHLAQHDEGIGIHLVNHLLRAVQLSRRDDAGKHIGFNAQVTGLSVQQGDAPVDVCQNGILHLLGVFGDDFQFGFGGAQRQQFVQGHGVHDNQNDAVEAGVLVGEEHLANQDDKIKYVQADGYGNPEEFLQDQRRNIHAAGAGPQPDDHRQGNADAQAAEEGAEEQILCQNEAAHGPLQDAQEQGVENGAHQCGEGEFLSQDESAQQEHGHIEDAHEDGNIHAGEVVHDQTDTGGAAGNQTGWKDKENDAHGVDEVSEDDNQYISEKSKTEKG